MHGLSQAILLTTMAAKSDQLNIELNELGQNMVIGDDKKKYFRRDHCIYLTKTMFKYLRVVYEDLIANAEAGEATPFTLASLSSIVRLLRTNLRCLSTCKVELHEIISKEECDGFEKL